MTNPSNGCRPSGGGPEPWRTSLRQSPPTVVVAAPPRLAASPSR